MEESPIYDWINETLEQLISHDREYWHSRTPQERVSALLMMNQKKYGYDPATIRIKRVITIVKLEDTYS